MRKKLVRTFKAWGQSVISIILGGLLILYMLLSFNINTDQELEKFIHENMQEMNQAAIISLNNSFQSFSNMLQLQSDVFSKLKNPTDEEIMSVLVRFADDGGFKNASIVTFDGKVYSSFRGITRVAKGDETPNLQKRETAISQPRVFHDGDLVIDISTPVYLDGEKVGKLVVSISSDYISTMFSDNLLGGDAALNLITQEGLVIAKISRRDTPLKAQSNAFDLYSSEGVRFINSSPEALSTDMSNDKSTWVKYDYFDKTICASYMPFGRNNWYMAISATDGTLHEQSGVIRRDALRLTLGIMAVVVLVSAAVVIQRLQERKRIDEMRNSYSIAIKKTNDLFYEADIDNDNFIDYSEQKDKTIWKEAPKNYSNALIQVAEICAPECRQQFLDTFLPQNIKIKMKQGISSINFEYKIMPDEETVRWLSATFVPVDDGSGGTKLICMENDITDRMLKQESLKRSATLDGLTGLFNRTATKTYINWYLDGEGKDGMHALALIDVDHFKLVNDSLGHIKGDEVLTEFSHTLKRIFRKSDIVGRVGGDEFVVLLKDYSVVELIMAKMKLVLDAFHREHYLTDDKSRTVETSASIGISIFDRDGLNFDTLYGAADLALYESKRAGRNMYTFYRPEGFAPPLDIEIIREEER